MLNFHGPAWPAPGDQPIPIHRHSIPLSRYSGGGPGRGPDISASPSSLDPHGLFALAATLASISGQVHRLMGDIEQVALQLGKLSGQLSAAPAAPPVPAAPAAAPVPPAPAAADPDEDPERWDGLS
jgi:hypothetical protein